MRPPYWQPPVELSSAEQSIIASIKRAKLFIFLRQNRHQLFDEPFQAELATIYKDSSVGQCPVPPAQLALALIVQAYMGISDDELIEELVMDKRWQLVLDCHNCQKPPFSKGTLVNFRKALIKKGFDQRLVERTVEIAKLRGGLSSSKLRAALDSSPLWGAARVEDTYNLLAHALRKAVRLIATAQERSLDEVSSELGAQLVTGSSVKTALDLNWDDATERSQALEIILSTLDTVESHLKKKTNTNPIDEAYKSLEVGRQIQSQDLTLDEQGKPKLKTGVAPDRRISIEDGDMRHGRKSRSQRFNGYKRHVLRDLDLGVVRAVGLTPANTPEAQVTDELDIDLKAQKVTLVELHIDRAYLSSKWVKERDDQLNIFCKAWPVRNGDRFDKTAFVLDWQRQEIRCPNQVSVPFSSGKVVQFPKQQCGVCSLRSRCTRSSKGRTVSIHPDEALMQELRERQSTPGGRTQLRQRARVEHTLAHVGQWQGNRARYIGLRKNLFDLRRLAVVHNLHVIDRIKQPLEN